jgi:hypothetical protein
MAKARNDSISGGSGGVSADMFEFGSGHIGGICDGSFTAGGGSGVSGKVSGTSSSNFVGVKSWKRRNNSIGGSSGGVGAVMLNFSGPNFRTVGNRSLATSGSCGMSGKMSGASSSNFVGVKSWEGGNDTVGSGCSGVCAVMFDFSGPDFGTVGNRSSSTSGSSVSGQVRSPCGGYFRRLLCWWTESGIREVEVRIVVPSSWVLLSGCKANHTQKHCENLIRKIQMMKS